MESTESMRENERFSPVPWVLSPPLSPPPISLYTSVALLHYHIHQHAPRTEYLDTSELPSSEIGSASTTPSPRRVAHGRRTTTALGGGLDTFVAVEDAVKRNPYMLPSGILTREQSMEELVLQEARRKRSQESMMSSMSGRSGEEVSEAERDSVVALLEGYSNEESQPITTSPQSSPFIEHSKAAYLREEDGFQLPTSRHQTILLPGESQFLGPLTPAATVDEDDHLFQSTTTTHDAIPENQNLTPPVTTLEPTSTGTTPPAVTDIKRMPSVQRRGAEYLAQFLAKRKSSPTQTPLPPSQTQPANKTRNTFDHVSILRLILYFLVLISVIANIFLATQIYGTLKPLDVRLNGVMKPGKVGETFDIFGPSAKIKLSGWLKPKVKAREEIMVEVVGSPVRVHPGAWRRWSAAQVSRRPQRMGDDECEEWRKMKGRKKV